MRWSLIGSPSAAPPARSVLLASSLPSTLRELHLGPSRSFAPDALAALRDALPAGATLE